jgi:hypothetical protein
LVDLHGNDGLIFDARLNADGEFRFTTDSPGQCLLLVMQKTHAGIEVIHTQAVELSEPGEMKISVVMDSAAAK